VNYISGHYMIDHDGIGAFLVDRLPSLEDDEVDLILSPVFTPKLTDQVIFANLLGRDSIPRNQWPNLIQQLVAKPIRARLTTPDGNTHTVTLSEVIIERYVQRLRLEGTIPELLFKLIDPIPIADLPLMKTIARRAVWEDAEVCNILIQYLSRTIDDGSYSLDEIVELLDLVETRKPASVGELLARIPAWQAALRQQLDATSGGKPFFLEDIRALHGGGRDQRQQDDVRLTAKQNELAFLDRLQRVLAR
jgi:hypothetical protein